MEDINETITRLKKELSTARATRDKIEKTGQSSSFGGISFSHVSYDLILKRISRLESAIFNYEAARDGSAVRADLGLVRVSQW